MMHFCKMVNRNQERTRKFFFHCSSTLMVIWFIIHVYDISIHVQSHSKCSFVDNSKFDALKVYISA